MKLSSVVIFELVAAELQYLVILNGLQGHCVKRISWLVDAWTVQLHKKNNNMNTRVK